MSSCLLLAILRIDTLLNILLKGSATMQEYARMSQQRGALLHPPFSQKVKKYVRFYTPMDALLRPHKCAFTPPRNTGKPYCIRAPSGVILVILFNPGGAA